MSHLQFELKLNRIYKDVTNYEEMRYNGRIFDLINTITQEQDFRYALPLLVMSDFHFSYFEQTTECPKEIMELIKNLYIRVRRISKDIANSLKNRDELASYHRCRMPKIDVTKIVNDPAVPLNILVESTHKYKMKSDFFYETQPVFNFFGPLYREVKLKTATQTKNIAWASLPMIDRRISSNNCVIEYYLYTGTLPIEGKLIKIDTEKTRMYLKPDVAVLRHAIRQRDLKLLGVNLSEYEKLPISVKRSHHALIIENYNEIKKYTKKVNQPYLAAWRMGNYEFTKENSKL